MTAHVAGDNKDTPFISTTDNFLWAVYYAFRATLTADPGLSQENQVSLMLIRFIAEQVYIYLISNDPQYRNCETQLCLASPSNRSQYLRICDAKPDYVDYKIYRKGKWDYRWDYSRENGEVLIEKKSHQLESLDGVVTGISKIVEWNGGSIDWWDLRHRRRKRLQNIGMSWG